MGWGMKFKSVKFCWFFAGNMWNFADFCWKCMLLCQGNLFIPLHTILMTSSSISTYISMFFFFFYFTSNCGKTFDVHTICRSSSIIVWTVTCYHAYVGFIVSWVRILTNILSLFFLGSLKFQLLWVLLGSLMLVKVVWLIVWRELM